MTYQTWLRLVAAAGLLHGAAALAQTATPEPSPDAGATLPQDEGRPDPIKAILEQEIQPAPGAYVYNPQGRRDPFVSLVKPVSTGRDARPRPSGPEGFLIQEVGLKGVVKTPAGYTAMILGTDNKSYFVKTGQRFYDGVIVAIDGSSVTFRQEVADPLSPVRTREVKKSLYSSEEARQ
jgi:Tfp pilus assembly protein PilP